MQIENNLEHYRVFYTVAVSGSLTEAAKELSITQPAVSQAIKLLETNLSIKLFHRMSKGVKLTQEGQLLFGYIEKGYEQFALGEKRLKQMLNLELGEIRIGASDMTLQYFLLPYLEIFHEKYPNIKVRVTNAPTPETLANLSEGKIDFGVVSTPFMMKDTIESIPVREIEDIFIAGRKFIPYKNKMLDLSQLEELPMIVLEGNTSSRTYMDDFLLKNHVHMNPEFELATSDMIVQFTLRNLGVGCVVKDFAMEGIEAGKLFALRFNTIIPKRQFCLVRDKKIPMSVVAEELLHIILQA